MEERNVILVTWDFTEKSEFALQHAIAAATNVPTPIILLHIAKKESDIPSVEQSLQAVIAERFADSDLQAEVLVKTGNIFTTIGETAEEINARMVFMGTHGIKGSQKFFGSWALKVIAHTKVPFIVVQSPPEGNIFEKIVFPVNFRKENKESVNWISYLSKYYGAKVHILTAKHTDPGFKKGVDSNVLFLIKNFKAKKVDYEVESTPGNTDFVKEILDYTARIDADSIFIMTTKDIGFSDYMFGANEQYIIANHLNSPVICVNPKPPKFGGSFSASG